MKKLIFIPIIFLFFTGKSQVTITDVNILNPGDSLFMGIDTLPNNSSILLGGTGQQTWDFSSLEEHRVDSVFLLHPDETPYYDVFPNSNETAFVKNDSMWVYLTKSANGLYTNGQILDIDDDGNKDTVIFEPQQLFIATPFTYNNIAYDTSRAEVKVSNLKLIVTVFMQDTADAYGNITIPLGTFESIRVHRTSVEIDSVFLHAGNDWVFASEDTVIRHEYSWWTNDSSAKFRLCDFKYNPQNNSIYDEISYLKENRFSGIKNIKTGTFAIKVFPNPSGGMFTFKNNTGVINKIEIIDISGKTIKTFTGNKAIVTVDLNKNSAGIYFAKITAGNKTETVKLVLK